jgi:hypothetical protein
MQSIVDIQEGGTKIRHKKAKDDTQQEPTKTKKKKKRQPKAGKCWSTIEEVSLAAQRTKHGVKEKKESLRTSGCDKFNVGEISADYKEADKGSSPLRSAEDVREVGSRVDIFS